MGDPPDRDGPMAWWVIAGPDLLTMLRQVQDGDDPGIVYAEHYANSDHTPPQDPR